MVRFRNNSHRMEKCHVWARLFFPHLTVSMGFALVWKLVETKDFPVSR